MNIYLALALCFVPFAITFFIIVKLCKVKVLHALLATFLGLLTLIPISILQIYGAGHASLNSSGWKIQFLKILIINGIIEEGIKMLAIFLIPKKSVLVKYFFSCSLLLGMSLGCFESAVYFLQRLQHATALGAHIVYGNIFTRMFTTDIIHTLCAGLSSFCVWSFARKKITVMPFIFAIFVHTLYDFFALYKWFHFFSYIAILFALFECRAFYKRATEQQLQNQVDE